MKRFVVLILGFSTLLGCHKDSPSKKIIDGLPAATGSTSTIQPAQATQQYLLLKNVALDRVITNLNRLQVGLPAGGLSGPSGSNYTFQSSEKHYGTATFTIQFQDVNNAAIDPFTAVTATSSVKYVHVTVNSTSNAFAISEDLQVSLDIVGQLTGPYHMTGTSNFDNSSYSITYTLDPTGVDATITGVLRGHASATSASGAPKQTSSVLTFGTNSDVSGKMTWDDQSAGIHINSDGSGFLTTDDTRTLFQ
jgi:hypothetical protein